MKDITKQIFDESFKVDVNFVDLLKIPLVILFLGNIFYSLMLSLKIKILIDTVEAEGNSKIKKLVYLNLILSIFIGIVGTFIIILS
ncbi:MAG: DUF5657 family protein [Candidatus Dojkabacteria bacterium]